MKGSGERERFSNDENVIELTRSCENRKKRLMAVVVKFNGDDST